MMMNERSIEKGVLDLRCAEHMSTRCAAKIRFSFKTNWTFIKKRERNVCRDVVPKFVTAVMPRLLYMGGRVPDMLCKTRGLAK